MQTLTFSNQTGIFSTTPGANGIITSAGEYGPFTRMNVFYRQSSSGEYAGYCQFRGQFAEPIRFPGTDLKFELWQPVNISRVDVEVTTTP